MNRGSSLHQVKVRFNMAIRETVRVTSSDELKDIIEKEYEANKTAAIIDLTGIDR